MDHRYAEIEGVAFAQAAFVRTTVTAVLGPQEVIVDAGTRAVSTDLGPPRVDGLDAVWVSAGDEHGRVTGAVGHLQAGDVLRLIPSHTDTTVVLHGAACPA
jgi:D-serine deaminase-like pyridoxal phosphate-dependent protein